MIARIHCAAVALLIGIGNTVALAAATPLPPPDQSVLDTMADVTAWKASASDGATASVRGATDAAGTSMELDFDLARTAGYAVASRVLPITLPDDYEISFWIRGEAGRNDLQVKFVDASGENVWWYRRANLSVTGEWQQIRIKRRQIEFAWGPGSDHALHAFQSIEFVVSAGADGGSGRLWFTRLALQSVTHAPAPPPSAHASSEQKGHPAALALDGNPATAWISKYRRGRSQTFEVDLHEMREFGGLQIDWMPGLRAPRYSIELSEDGASWREVRHVEAGSGGRDTHLLPDSAARYLRLVMPDPGRDVGISEITLRDLQFGASPNAFVRSLALEARRGCYPRAYRDEQTYWTIVGVEGAAQKSLLSEDGALEARRGGFSVEPFIHTSGGLLTWADVTIKHSLADEYLPVPSVSWQHPDIELTTTAYGSGSATDAATTVTYRLQNPQQAATRVTLALVVRPLQVNPPTQFLNTPGGVSPIQDLAYEDGRVLVDGRTAVVAASAPRAFQAVATNSQSPCDWLAAAPGASHVHDEAGFAAGALLYDADLGPGEHQDITLVLPLQGQTEAVAGSRDSVEADWREQLNRVALDLPAGYRTLSDTLRTSLAFTLLERDGAAIQPGTRSYARSWIRDGAMTSELLLRLGHEQEAKDFLRWYASHQFASGKVPCCVDARGADPVPENDSEGEFLFLIDVIYRYTGDKALLHEMWPAAVSAVQYMEKLRLSERTPENQQGARKAFYGLMPASISHEGYSAKPMHSYWDDYWALAGYEAAVRIARAMGEKGALHRFLDMRDQFRADLYHSLQIAMQQRAVDYLPGSAELGDFDATSISIALSPLGEQQMLPPDALEATFSRYWQQLAARRSGSSWDAYTPYEWRNLGTFVRLRWRDRGMQLIESLMQDRRPVEWNQWAEVVGREARQPRFIGDMPHGWVAAEFGRALLDMFAYERPFDETLVLMAGVPQAWIEKEGFAVRNLRTPFGQLSYSLKFENGERVLDVAALNRMPPGGVAIAWPEGQRPPHQSTRRGQGRWVNSELRISQLPFTIVFSP